jgi:hypothetical protein
MIEAKSYWPPFGMLDDDEVMDMIVRGETSTLFLSV